MTRTPVVAARSVVTAVLRLVDSELLEVDGTRRAVAAVLCAECVPRGAERVSRGNEGGELLEVGGVSCALRRIDAERMIYFCPCNQTFGEIQAIKGDSDAYRADFVLQRSCFGVDISKEDKMAESTRTQDGGDSQTWDRWSDELVVEQVLPRLRLLYHVDLSRIGALSHPDIPLTARQWQTVGRKEPLFISPRPDGVERPIEDPTISREQLQIRFLPDEQVFEVAISPQARRGVSIVDLSTGISYPVNGTAKVAPGGCIAIDDRVLLGLELGTYHEPEEDRLGLLGETEVMWRLRNDIREVAGFRRSALILGQTGSGKELVAHAIHKYSDKSKGPFLTINCGALPENLVESILFGHKKGAFTGAEAHHDGVFRAADGGTLFLDELAEMPMQVQPKLLRTLQDGQVFVVGQNKSVRVDVRLVFATHRDPLVEIAAGRLREDLYHRISGHIVRVPELRARRFDIPEFFLHFLRVLCEQHPSAGWLFSGAERWQRSIPMTFFVDLLRCGFSGNVRELENIAERTVRHNVNSKSFKAPELPVTPARTPATDSSSESRSSATVKPLPAPTAVLSHVAAASQALGLAHKTVAKLFSIEMLAHVFQHETDVPTALQSLAVKRLQELLVTHGAKQRPVAAALDMSPTTLAKLLQRFGLASDDL